jgi:hypothetical protein
MRFLNYFRKKENIMPLRTESELSSTESIASVSAEATSKPVVPDETIAAEFALPPTEVAPEAPAASHERPPAASSEQRQAPAPDPVVSIRLIKDPTERARALLALAHANSGGVRFDNGLTIVSNGRLWRSLVDLLIENRGEVMKLLPGAFVSSSSEDRIVGTVLDEPLVPFTEPDPPSGSRMVCRPGQTQREAIEWLTAPGVGSLIYWGARRAAIRTQLLKELGDELTEPAIGAGVLGFSSCWIRRRNGDLLSITRD